MRTSVHGVSQFAAALLDAGDPPPVLRMHGGASTQRRWSVHRATVRGGLVDTLATAFPVARQVVGDAFFDAMSGFYVVQALPRSPVLDEYGDDYPDFAEHFAPAAGVPYLADVMRLERLHVRIGNAADATPLGPDAFRPLLTDPTRLFSTRARLHPACGWLRSAHPIAAVWHAHPAAGPVNDAVLAGIDLSNAEDVLVARPGFDIGIVALPPGAVEMLDAVQAGATFGDALANAAAGTVEPDPELLFAVLLRHGLVVALDS